MNNKIVSIIILCLMLSSTLPLSFNIPASAEKSKSPKSPGGEVSNVRIVYDSKYNTTNYTCWKTGYGSSWNGTSYNDLNTVKNAGVIRRNTTFNVTATGISSANTVRVKGPCDVGEPRPNITTWNPQYDSTPDPDVWNFTVPSNAPVGDYQLYLNESYCTVYVIFDVFLTKTPSGMNDTEFSSWAYNETNNATNYTIVQVPTSKLIGYGWPFEERTTEMACSVMGKDTTTPFIAAIKLYRVINARVTWVGTTGSELNLTWLLNANTGLTLSEGKKVALQTGETLPANMVVENAQCTHFACMMSTWPRSMGIPARSCSDEDAATEALYSDYWTFHNWAEVYIDEPDMTLSSADKDWLVFDASDQSTTTTRNSNGGSSIDSTHNYMFAADRLDKASNSGDAVHYYVWDGVNDPSLAANWDAIDQQSNYSYGISDIPTITPSNVTVGWLGAGDRDFFRIDVSGYSQVSLGFTEGAEYAQIYVNNTTTLTNTPGFSPVGADLKTAYYGDLVWGDDRILDINVGTDVNYFYVMVDNAKEFQYANDYAKDGSATGKPHAMAELHRWVIGVEPLPPNVTVKSPNGNEVLIAGKTYNITWNATIINSSRLASSCINISYSYNGGAWTEIATGEVNDGFFVWNVPDINYDDVLIKITCNTTDNKEGYDISDSNFTIRGATPFRELSSGTGNTTGDRFGWNVSYAGDLNNDSYDDIVVGAPYVTYNSVSGCGAVYIFFGYSNISLGNLTATYANVSIYGAASGGHFGWSVSNAGDVNQTSGGIDDLIIGEPDNDTGVAYLFFGRSSWSSTYTTADVNVTLTGEGSNDKFGFAVSGIGDVNNDDYDDVIVGAYANGTDKGKAYIYYGRASWPTGDVYIHPDAVADEILTEGVSAGGDYTYTQVDDGVTRNITEKSTPSYILVYVDDPLNETITEGVEAGGDYDNTTADDDVTRNITEADLGEAGVGGNATANAIGASDTTTDVIADVQANDTSGASPTAVAADDGWYTVDKGIVMFIDGFSITGMSGTVTAAKLCVEYSVEAGYDGTLPIRWALDGGGLATTGITPADADPDDCYKEYDLYAQGVDTLTEISTLDIEFTSDDGAGPDAVSFDFVWINVTCSGSVDYSLNVSYVLDDANIGDYSSYVLEFRANASNLSTNSNENFTVEYSIDGGAYQSLGVGYILNGTGEQSLSETLSTNPAINVTVRITDNTTGATPTANTIRIDFIELNCSTSDYSLNVSYVLDGVGSYASYTIEFQATALNTTTNSAENFTVNYSVDGGAWDALGVGYILNQTSEQTLSETTYAVPTINVTVRITDNTTGATPDANTIRIDFIELHGSTTITVNVTLTGENDNDKFGYSVSDAGNVNGDDYDDVIVGAPGYDDGRGSVYVYYGRSGSWEGVGGTETIFGPEGFEGATFPPTDWTQYACAGDELGGAWGRYGTSPDPEPGCGSWYAKHPYSATLVINYALETPDISLSGYTNCKLDCYPFLSGNWNDEMFIEVSTDGGGVSGTWNEIAHYVNSGGAWTGWQHKEISMSAYDNEPSVHIRFRTYQPGDNNVECIDEVKVIGDAAGGATPNITLTGESSNNNFGFSVSGLDDINNDGYDDVGVGAPNHDSNRGRAYVYFGGLCMPGSDEVTITQQPGDNGDHWVGKDCWLDQGNPTFNYGISTGLNVKYSTTDLEKLLIQFDVSMIGSDTIITDATLKLYCYAGTEADSVTISLYRVTNPWHEGIDDGVAATGTPAGATWNNRVGTTAWTTAGGDYDSTAETSISVSSYAWYTWNITSLVQKWVNKTTDNYGLILVGTGGVADSAKTFYTADYAADHSLTPKLVLTIRKNADMTISGDKAGDKFGYSVSGKDLNNDSFSDIIVGAPYKDNGTKTKAGAVYVFFGNTTMPSITNASHADNETFGNKTNMTLGFSVSFADLNKDGYNDIIAGAYNYSSDKGKVYALTCRRATLTVSNWTKNETTTVNVGTNDVLMLNMTLNASECTIRVTNIRVNLTNLTGTGVDADVSACRLFHDKNNDGAYDAEDEFLGNQTFSGGSLNFTLSFDVASGAPEKLLLLFNITNSADAVGNYTGANLTDYSFISVARPDNVSSYNFPIQSTNMEITSGVAADTLTVNGTSMAPGFVNQGAVNRTMLNLTFNASANDITVMSINISLTGTGIGAGNNANVSNVTIYNDTNKDGILNAGDTQLNTTQIFSNGYVLFGDLNFNVYYAAGNYTIFVVYEINNTATINATVGANITDNTKIEVASSDSVDAFSTIWSNNSTIIEPKGIGVNYTIRNGTTNLEEGVGYRKWGNWTIDPGDPPTNSTNWLRIRNTNCSNPNQQVIVDFSDPSFNNTTTGGSIPINGNITFWFFFTNLSSDKPNGETVHNTTNLTTGSYTFTFNKVGEYIWILYRMEGIPDILPDAYYTAGFTIQVPS